MTAVPVVEPNIGDADPAAPVAIDVAGVVACTWQDQARWSQVGSDLKQELDNWRVAAGLAGVVGALFETAAVSLTGAPPQTRTVIAIVGAVILAVVPYVAKTKVSRDDVQRWVRARSASELLKQELYRFLVAATPYGAERSPRLLVARREAIKADVRDLARWAGRAHVAPRTRPLELTIDEYVDQRVNGQIAYYRTAGEKLAGKADLLHNVVFWLGLLAVVFGALTAAGASSALPGISGLGPWVAVITTASAAVTAHLAAARYDQLTISYFGTADHLASQRDLYLTDPLQAQRAAIEAFVDQIEQTISSENQAWIAEWKREETGAPP